MHKYIDEYIEKWRYCLCIYVALTRSTNKSITTDPDDIAIAKTRNEHCCGKEQDPSGSSIVIHTVIVTAGNFEP
jgi:hypothetical protein